MRNEDYLREVGMMFRLERTRQRLSLQALADKIRMEKDTVMHVENARSAANILTLKKIADGLGKPLSEFV